MVLSAAGDTVTFKVGNVIIGTYDTANIGADRIVMPQDIVGVSRSDIAHPDVLQIGRLLQTLDANGDLTDGIDIPEEALTALTSIQEIDMSAGGITDQMLSDLLQAVDPALILLSMQEAVNHYMNSLSQYSPNDVVDQSAVNPLLELVTLSGTLTPGGEEGIIYRLSFGQPVNFNFEDLMVSGGTITGYIEDPETPNAYMLLVAYSDLTSSTVRIDIAESAVMNYKGFVNTTPQTVLTDLPTFVSNVVVNNGETVNIQTAENGIVVTGFGLPGALVNVNGVVASQGSSPSTWTVTLPGPFEPINDFIDIIVLSSMAGRQAVGYSTTVPCDLIAPNTPMVEIAQDTGAIDGLTNNPQMVVSGFDQADLVLYSLNNGLSWQEVVGNSFDLIEGENTVIVKAVDAAGNESAASVPITLTYDSTGAGVQDWVTSADIVSLASGDVTYTVTFSEPVAGFDMQNIVIANGFLASLPEPVEGMQNTYSFRVGPQIGFEGSLEVTIDGVVDLAGNPMPNPSVSMLITDTLSPEIVPVQPQAPYEPEFVGTGFSSMITINLASQIPEIMYDPQEGWPLTVAVNGFQVAVLDMVAYNGTTIEIMLDTMLSRSDVVTVSGTLHDYVGNPLNLVNEPVRNEMPFFESVSTPAFIASTHFVERDINGNVNYIELIGEGFNQFLDVANGASDTSDVTNQFDFSRLAFYTDVMDSLTGVPISASDIVQTNILYDEVIRIYLTETAANALMADVNFGATTNGVVVQNGFIGHPSLVSSQAELQAQDSAFTYMSFTYNLISEPMPPEAHVKSITLLGNGTYSGNLILIEGADIVTAGDGNITLTDIPAHINSITSMQMGGGTLTIESWAGDVQNKIITGQEGAAEGTIIVKALTDSFDLGSFVTGIELVGDGITLETDGTLANFAFGNGDQLLKVNEMPLVDGQVSVSGFDALADDIDLTALGGIFATEGLTDRLASTSFKSYAGALEAGNIDADDRILFDSTTGVVAYDADGSGAGSEAVTLFILTGQTVLNNPTAITAEDFRVAVA